ncbi:MAG: 50S ribosomal protein L29 [Nanoarchaeota archaeon]|nr:50S ribosomal protein L29 [Nanoarchaeota archaeon]
MRAKEMRMMQENQLNERIKELEKELMKLNAQVATGTNPKSPGQIKKIKKTIARIKTVLHEKEINT